MTELATPSPAMVNVRVTADCCYPQRWEEEDMMAWPVSARYVVILNPNQLVARNGNVFWTQPMMVLWSTKENLNPIVM